MSSKLKRFMVLSLIICILGASTTFSESAVDMPEDSGGSSPFPGHGSGYGSEQPSDDRTLEPVIHTPAPTATPVPDVPHTSEPAITEVPATPAPADTESPTTAPTQQPSDTVDPSDTQEPTNTEQPSDTEQPIVTEPPVGTEAPGETQSPEPTEDAPGTDPTEEPTAEPTVSPTKPPQDGHNLPQDGYAQGWRSAYSGWQGVVNSSEKAGMDIPVYYQLDFPSTIVTIDHVPRSVKSSGCGITSLSMIIAYLTGNTEQNPYSLFVEAIDTGNYWGSGWTHTALSRMGSRYGIHTKWIKNDPNLIKQALMEGKPVIAHMGPGIFTNKGHYVVLRGVTADGKILLNDPASRFKTYKAFPVMTLIAQARRSNAFCVCWTDAMEQAESDMIPVTPEDILLSEINTDLDGSFVEDIDYGEDVIEDAPEIHDDTYGSEIVVEVEPIPDGPELID